MSELPTPSARAASWALQTAGKMEPPVGIGLDEPEQEQGYLLEVVGQPLGRALDLEHVDALGRIGVGGGRGQPVGVDGRPQLLDGVR